MLKNKIYLLVKCKYFSNEIKPIINFQAAYIIRTNGRLKDILSRQNRQMDNIDK